MVQTKHILGADRLLPRPCINCSTFFCPANTANTGDVSVCEKCAAGCQGVVLDTMNDVKAVALWDTTEVSPKQPYEKPAIRSIPEEDVPKEAKLEIVKARIAHKKEEQAKNPQPQQSTSFTPPRFDNVYVEGAAWVESLANGPPASRETTPRGTRDSAGKTPWSLLPWDAVKATVGVLQYGATKYSDRNWERGYSYSRTFESLMRHLLAWYQEGEEKDPESGHHHLAHVVSNALFLLTFVVRGRKDLDDRPNKKKEPL